jgi:hypothetical protein
LSRSKHGAEHSGVLVIRVWAQGDRVVRARVTRTLDVAAGDEETSIVASVNDVFDALRRWLDDLLTTEQA